MNGTLLEMVDITWVGIKIGTISFIGKLWINNQNNLCKI